MIDTDTVAYRAWICGVCFDALDEPDDGAGFVCPACLTTFTATSDDRAPADDPSLDATAVRDWRCGRCTSSADPHGSDGDLMCVGVGCGRIFRPSPDGLSATLVPSDDDLKARYDR